MTKEEYENKIAELQTQIDELKKAKVEEDLPTPPHPRWKPERDEPYYTIHVGCACAGLNTWDSDTLDGDIYSLGFVFKTEVETEFAIERLKVIAEMREWAGTFGDKYVIVVDKDSTHWRLRPTCCEWLGFPATIYFATIEDAYGCIEAVGEERIKKYYFMIPETK